MKCREVRRPFFSERGRGFAEFAALNRSDQSFALAIDGSVEFGQMLDVQEVLALDQGNRRLCRQLVCPFPGQCQFIPGFDDRVDDAGTLRQLRVEQIAEEDQFAGEAPAGRTGRPRSLPGC